MSETNVSGKKNKSWVIHYAGGYTLAIKFIFILAFPLVGGFACGIWLDGRLHTTPWLMLILIFISLVFSIYAVYRTAVRLQEELKQSRE